MQQIKIFSFASSFLWQDSSICGKGGICFQTSGKISLDAWAMAVISTQREKWNIKVLMALVVLEVYHNSLHFCSYLLWAVLVPPSLLPWQKKWWGRLIFLHVTGLTQEAFYCLLYIVIPPGHSMRRQRRGGPWSLQPDWTLGLLLCYLGSQMTTKWLCLIFGITPTLCSCILKKVVCMTVKHLCFHPLARIRFLDKQKM